MQAFYLLAQSPSPCYQRLLLCINAKLGAATRRAAGSVLTDEKGLGEAARGLGEGGGPRQIEGITQKQNLSMQPQAK